MSKCVWLPTCGLTPMALNAMDVKKVFATQFQYDQHRLGRSWRLRGTACYTLPDTNRRCRMRNRDRTCLQQYSIKASCTAIEVDVVKRHWHGQPLKIYCIFNIFCIFRISIHIQVFSLPVYPLRVGRESTPYLKTFYMLQTKTYEKLYVHREHFFFAYFTLLACDTVKVGVHSGMGGCIWFFILHIYLHI
jgi:hypothetical protein